MTNQIDYTERRENGKMFCRCPKCGLIGKVSRYEDKSRHYIHKGYIVGMMFFMVTNSCMITWNEFKALVKEGIKCTSNLMNMK